jgi:hypothetical protein
MLCFGWDWVAQKILAREILTEERPVEKHASSHMTPRNQKLYTAMKTFCVALVRLIADQVDHRKDLTIGLTSSNFIEGAHELPEYQLCIDTLKGDSVISSHLDKRIGIAGFGYTLVTPNGLLDALVKLISEGKEPVFDDLFDQTYTEFEDTFYCQTVECEAIAPVQGWWLSGNLQERSGNTPLIKLSDNLRISQLSVEEEKAVHLMELVRRYGFRWTDQLYGIRATYQRAKLVLRIDEEIASDVERVAEEEFVQINDRIEEVLETVRVFRKGSIRQGGIYHRVNSWLLSGIMRNMRKPLGDPIANLTPMYLLETEQDLAELEGFWKSVQIAKAKGHRFLNVAMRRFAESNERHHVEDRLIDLMIAAQALSQSSSSKAKGGVIAEYVGTHVVETDKSKVRGIMQNTYKLRNSIVHDGDASGWLKRTGKQPGDVMVVVNTAEEYLREALKKTVMEAAQ